MRGNGKHSDGESIHRTTRRGETGHEVEQLCGTLFASLRRRDQRDKARSYVTGLLRTPGRKSVRNIAQMFGGSGTEQSLHHFISDSNWDWKPVRRALLEHVCASRPVRAWVAEPMVVPKTGEQSVGVVPSSFNDAGRVLNVQLSFGIWAASERGSVPVAWWLHVPREWLADSERRSRALVPEDLRPATLEGDVVKAFQAVLADGADAGIPFVLDATRLDASTVARHLTAAGTPYLLRVGQDTPLVVRDPALPGRDGTVMTAGQIAWASRSRRSPVTWADPWEDGAALHANVVAPVSVRLPRVRSGLRLLCIGGARPNSAPNIWLTNLTEQRLPEVMYSASLVRRVRQEGLEIAERVGIRDYSGRTFTGWHRHATLASVAHALLAKRLPRRQLREAG